MAGVRVIAAELSDTIDPFDTAALRAAVLAAWRDSPTRLREDAATEADLVRAGYRDRVLTELAQNAADAAAKAGVAGDVSVRLVDRTLYVTNTGAPLERSGVHALTALRASGKPGAEESVGRFGVGFTAVLSVSDEVEIRSTTGSLRFSRTATEEALRAAGVAQPSGDGALRAPTLRLVWPTAYEPTSGSATEVVLRLRDDVDVAALWAAMLTEVPDLLLELPALQRIRLESAPETTVEFTEVTEDLGAGLELLRIDGPEGTRSWWQYRTARSRWLLPLHNGIPVRAQPDVLRAPTRSDEELSLPALLVADIAMQPDRRRLLPGAVVTELAEGYADFALALPPMHRLLLVPPPGFARSEADGLLRAAVVDELRSNAWLPVLASEAEGVAEEPVRATVAIPGRASVFTDLSVELADMLGAVLEPLVTVELSEPRHAEALGVLDVHRLGLARLAELSAALRRPPEWWARLYAALEPFVLDPLSAEELGALAVPLADGRLVTGPRTTVLDDGLRVAVGVRWARLVHPEAAHPLLARLGARSATVEDVLSDPALAAELADEQDPETVDAVLRLAERADPAVLPEWLARLELPDTDGELRAADELLLADAPLRELLAEDAPFGVVAPGVVEEYGAQALRAVGVGWGFSLVVESDPTGPDHDLDDEHDWWAGLAAKPRELVAVRDLDLLDSQSWPEALWQLASDPRTRPLLTDRAGYTAWWLRGNARIDGTPLGLLRDPSGAEFAGLLPDFEVAGLVDDSAVLRALLADPSTITAELAAALLGALADAAKTPTPETVARTHALLATAVAERRLDLADLDLPERVRVASGAVADPEGVFVLDEPCFGLVVPADRLVVGDPAVASALAELLELAPVSGAVRAEVLGAGRAFDATVDPPSVVLRQQFSTSLRGERLVLHDDLRVRLTGAIERTVSVPWWSVGEALHVRAPHSVD